MSERLRTLLTLPRRLWHARLRRIDIRILWPSCKELADGDLTTARAAFAVHAMHDEAWLSLGKDEIAHIIDGLM